MGGRFLLDTNIIVALFAGDLKVHELIANASEVFVPSIAIGELYFGAYKSSKVRKNHARIDEFALNNTVLPCNADTTKRYGDIKFRLKEKGQRFPRMISGLPLSPNNILLRLLHEIRILKP